MNFPPAFAAPSERERMFTIWFNSIQRIVEDPRSYPSSQLTPLDSKFELMVVVARALSVLTAVSNRKHRELELILFSDFGLAIDYLPTGFVLNLFYFHTCARLNARLWFEEENNTPPSPHNNQNITTRNNVVSSSPRFYTSSSTAATPTTGFLLYSIL